MELMTHYVTSYADIEALFRHALLFILQTHCEICAYREVQWTHKETQLLTRESFILPFQNQSPSNDFLVTPQIVYDTSWMPRPCQVTQVDGPDELVV